MPLGRGGGANNCRCRGGSLNASETGESTKCPNSTTPTQGRFVLSPVSLASRDQDDGPVEQNDRHLRSHGKIEDCVQSKKDDKNTSKPVASRHLNPPNHSTQHMAVCGLSLHKGRTESRKTLAQKVIFQMGTLDPHGINGRFSFN